MGRSDSSSSSNTSNTTTTTTATIANAFNNALNTTQNFSNIGTAPAASNGDTVINYVLIIGMVLAGFAMLMIFKRH